MKRIIIDSQSNRLFAGVEMEQNYDQRGGLCEVGEGHLIVTINPINQVYLNYWSDTLGFTLPTFLVAGPFDSKYTLSEHIINKPELQKAIKDFVGDSKARLEFFCIEEAEKKLTEVLGIPAYCNFDVSIPFARKILFKKTCEKISIPTSPWFHSDFPEKTISRAMEVLDENIPILLKVDDGTGGMSCGGILKIDSKEDLQNETINDWQNNGIKFFSENIIPDVATEVSLHWEITENGEIDRIKFFNQLSTNFSYAGVSYPLNGAAPKNIIKSQLINKLGPHLVKKGAKGFFCCDIIVDKDGIPYWIDLNPRKGAVLYVWSYVRRLSQIHFSPDEKIHFYHKHLSVASKNGLTFEKVRETLINLLEPSGTNPFVVVTNPGVIQYGYVDITGISINSKSEAEQVFKEAQKRLG